jgi:hypothetical protein
MYDNNPEMRDDNHEILNKFFQLQEDWINDYIKTDDYMGGYEFCIWEGVLVVDNLKCMFCKDIYKHSYEGIREACGISENAKLPSLIFDYMVQVIRDDDLIECNCVDEYSSECNGYLDSIQVGEYENQIEVSSIDKEVSDLLTLPNDKTTFKDILKEYLNTQREFCLNTFEIERSYATIEHYVNTGMRIEFSIPTSSLEEMTTKAILNYCTHQDRNRKDRLSVK